MNSTHESNSNNIVRYSDIDAHCKDIVQSSLEMYEMYSPDKNKARYPFMNSQVIGLVEAVTGSINYTGPKNLTMGNYYFNRGRYNRAIENYILNVLPEKYTLTTDKKESIIGLSRCYLKLGDISSSINYLYKASTLNPRVKKMIIAHDDLYLDLCSQVKKRFKDGFDDKKAMLDNSIDLYEFIDELMDDKSGWELAHSIVNFVIENN